MSNVKLSDELIQKIQKITAKENLEEGVKELLVVRARSELIKYDTIVREFERKYKMNFEAFKKNKDLQHLPPDAEQDYFDWEFAVTMTDDLREELETLEK